MTAPAFAASHPPGTPPVQRREVFAWAMFDFANSSYTTVIVTVAFSVVYAMTGSVLAGGLVALVEPACNTVAYHFHEKVWAFIRRRQQETASHSAFA